MFARVSIVKGPSDRVEEGMKLLNDMVLPRVKELPGLTGGYWLLDQDRDRVMAITIFDSEESLNASQEDADRIRDEVASHGLTVQSVETFEVVAQV